MKYGEHIQDWSKSSKIQVRVKDGKLVQFYSGEPLPELTEGAKLEITINAKGFKNKKERILHTLKQSVMLFPPGQELWMTFTSRRSILHRELPEHAGFVIEGGINFLIGTKMTLLEPMSLLINGINGGAVRQCKVNVPLIGIDYPSLNQAYTRLSRIYEPERKTHTGSVFKRVWYNDEGRWYSLDHKRMECLETVKKQFQKWYEQNQHRCVQSSIGDFWFND